MSDPSPKLAELFKALGLLQSLNTYTKLPALEPKAGLLRVKTSGGKGEMLDEESMLDRIKKFSGEGWVCFTEAVIVKVDPRAIEEASQRGSGFILSAEFADGDRSLHVRLQGAQWRVTEIARENDDAGWLIPHRFIAARGADDAPEIPGNSKTLYLGYEVFWQSLEQQPFCPVLSRFTGFIEF
jgi:hypothetical protein